MPSPRALFFESLPPGRGGSKKSPKERFEGAHPLDAPQTESWTWIPIEGSQCADGTEAGIGVNFG